MEVDPIYKAIWADNKSFDEVLISKRMVQDHMPDNVLDALTQVSFINCELQKCTIILRTTLFLNNYYIVSINQR